jgi:lincosamide nucleotidyltransferase A/C/D/E
MMQPDHVIEVVGLVEDLGMPVWIDGGWGVDALLEEQTREHQDLDIAIKLSDAATIIKALESKGYKLYEDEMPTRLEMRGLEDRRVDLHPLTFDAQGNGLQQLQDGSYGKYTAEGLSGLGKVAGRIVKCLSPALQLKFHTGYIPDENDRHDVQLIVDKYGLSLPSSYQ